METMNAFKAAVDLFALQGSQRESTATPRQRRATQQGGKRCHWDRALLFGIGMKRQITGDRDVGLVSE